MLKDWNRPERPGEEELEERLQAARAKLAVQQMQIKEHKLRYLYYLRAGGLRERAAFWGKSLKKLIRGFLRLPLWMFLPKRKRGNPSSIVIS